MSNARFPKLNQLLRKIDRPGSFCVSGSVPFVLPGLEVDGVGPIGLPLTAKQAKELKKHCERAPYGKGTETVVDTNVRRVWRLQPDHFALTNPEWHDFLRLTVLKVQEELGLEKQPLESHLYDLLLYEPGGFFLPHRDGEKLDRMVGTLVVGLPSTFEGGELVVRHDGQEQTVDFGCGSTNLIRIHFAAFYADCEHEVRPVRSGYRLCLVYNLTLKKGKKAIAAPRTSAHVEPVSKLLSDWASDDAARRLVVTLDHQYTQDGLTWDALKGADRAKAQVLLEAARRADCRAYLALLTLHQAGSAEGGDYSYRPRRSWEYDEDDEDDSAGDYEMGEIYDSSLTADHWLTGEGKSVTFGELPIEEEELVDPERLEAIEPEEEFEGYTGNAGMTLDRWYCHAAIILWPEKRHFEVLCDAGSWAASAALQVEVQHWQRAAKKDVTARKAACVAFATTIIARWQDNAYGMSLSEGAPNALMMSLAALDEPSLIQASVRDVLPRDASVDPGKLLSAACQRHGLAAFQRELEDAFRQTTTRTLERNVRLLEQICTAKSRGQADWNEGSASLAQALFGAIEQSDQKKTDHDFGYFDVKRATVLAGLARALLATDQCDLLGRVVAHALAHPKHYPLISTHVAALTSLGPWLKKYVKEPCPGLSDWLEVCCAQLETRTAEMPQPPADFRRSAAISCKCADCAELKTFLADPHESVHRFRVREDRRSHLQHRIREYHCDLNLKTERTGSPYALVCTKNTASYEARLKTYHEDQEHLATLRALQKSLS